MPSHRLDAGPDTVHWGFFDAALKPLKVDTVAPTVSFSAYGSRAHTWSFTFSAL